MNKYTSIDSPIGPLLVARDGEGITALLLPHGRRPARPAPDWVLDDSAFADVRTQLAEYFAGARTSFELPLHLIGSAFQRRVWTELLRIPCGETTSYGAIAVSIGAPGAARAVGLANGRNPIALIVPCHRVIGANGSLTGYGGGLPTKQWLLQHERQQPELFTLSG
ncbi:MAG: methylated-DNA-[protein]-cysteine S-methyltransferase [Pseudonocardiales bacterium]|jgi:methylated-DNA-[protein]-cysteine S-methyltransferase|nr:methylated-DNA-[protein]-cysteine S-methyltransferase [Pseudonocardiales bacterium]